MKSCGTLFGGVAFLLLWGQGPALAEDVYLAPDDFINQVYEGDPPPPQKLWLKKPLQENIKKILDRPYQGLRLRYWLKDGRSTWILEAIGKVKLITAGYTVGPEGIERLQVLIYRESHGWEVRYTSFTDQFKGSKLQQPRYQLTESIDGIAGATLSVNSLTRLARVALLLHQEVTSHP